MSALPFAGLALWRSTGGAWAWWLTTVVVFGLIPVIDLFIGDDRRNPPEEAVPRLAAGGYYRWLTCLYLPAQCAALVVCCAVARAPAAYGHFHVEHTGGHHVRVATPEDPASPRLGESIWAFW
ncbi:hypothetical protein [Micromonospora sp. CA-246542]|uniref:hypothetical protein n=1 Tax=Micromonospora sp. CA-246542 TaxID=3239959 RepID=UPI003D90EBDA